MGRTKTVSVTDEVRAVLQASTIDERSVILPPKLDRKTYDAVMKVLDAAGGKWDRRAKAHVFPAEVNPREVFAEALTKGTIVHEKKTRQAFYTPTGLAHLAVGKAQIEPKHLVLEPSAGNGALVRFIILTKHKRCTAIEIDPATCIQLRDEVGDDCLVIEKDFLTLTPDDLGLFDRVVMNPPFTDGQDIEHVRHAFKFLKPKGRMVAIMASSVTTRQDSRYREFRDFLGFNTTDLTTDILPAGTFAESGTNVQTVMLSCEYVPNYLKGGR